MQQFPSPGPVSAVVDIPAGLVQVIAADRSDTTVEVRPANPSKSRDVAAAEKTTVEFADGTLRVVTPQESKLRNPGSVEVTVQVPADSKVDVKAAAAEFRGVGRLGEVTFDGAAATVKLDEAAAVDLKVMAGDVTVGRLGGDATISAQKGDITVNEAVQGTLTLETQYGDISVAAAKGVSATLDAGTSYGRIQNSLQNSDGATAGLNVHATTAYGNVSARSL